jgi:lysine 2,3-aminomutase
MTVSIKLKTGEEPEEVTHLKPPVDPKTLTHKDLLSGEFWRAIPAYKDIDAETFGDHKFQMRNTISRVDKLLAAVQDLVPTSFYDDVAEGFRRAPMSVRVSPYLLSLIDWEHPYDDPLRKQFIPVGSLMLPNHPKVGLDSLHEQHDAPTPGLTHRYRDKALFLTLDTCPVYCRFCTRSYAVGIDTDGVEKVSLKAKTNRWSLIFKYISERPEIEDIVISGGDSYNLRAAQIRLIGETLLDMPNIRRIRWATKGPAVMPQKILTDEDWVRELTWVADHGRKLHKEVVVHTHFNHSREITDITRQAMGRLYERGIIIRNQCVLQCGVNDTVEEMRKLTRRLSYCNVQPYYVYVHDLVGGVEDLRTSVQTAGDIEKRVRGDVAGFNTPTFVCDAPGGGGKRQIHSYEHYDRKTGISVYTSPAVKGGFFLYYDPLRFLDEENQARWADESQHQVMIDDAMAQARAKMEDAKRASTINCDDAEGPIH